jgi:adenylate cyclase
MSLIAELRRRHVFEVGGAYVVIAWLVVQAASIAFPAFEAPPWVLRVFILILMLGFPIALVMAWAFEATPEGLRLEPAPLGNKRMALIASGLACLALAWYFVGQPAVRESIEAAKGSNAATGPAAAGKAASAPSPAAAPRKSIAVLPFVNMSADKDNEYFSDGISEELLNVLVRVPGLGVASRTSSFAYKDRRDLGAVAIARELNVAHVLEGSVRKSGSRVRITAQLIDAAADRHLWSETYDRELDDIFAIQDEIAKAIAAALRVQLDAAAAASAASARADTENVQAYDVYLKARELFIARRELPESVRLFERAIALDPEFARAYEGLAAVAAVMRGWGYDERDYMAMVEPAATRALELDPMLSTPWAARSMARKQHWPIDYTTIFADLERASAADPRNATAVFWRGIAWAELGYFDRALADFDRCLELEPGYDNCRSHRAMALLLKGDEDAAFAEFERTVANGSYGSRNDHFVAPLLRRGNRLAGLMLLDVNDVEPELRAHIVASIEHPGPPPENAKALIERHYETALSSNAKTLAQSRLYLWLGDFAGIDASDASDIATTQIVAWERDPSAFRNSPAMKRKLVALGALAYWRQHGFPPQCRPQGDGDFHCD